MALLRLVVLERVQQERRRRLDHVLGHEDVNCLVNINRWSVQVIQELSSKLCTLVGVRTHHMLEEAGVVEGVAELTGLSEACNDLARHVGAEIQRQSKGHVVEVSDVARLLAERRLVLLEPLLPPLPASLLRDGTSKLDGL